MGWSRKRLIKRYEDLLGRRATYDSHWEEIAEVLMPRASRFNRADVDNGTKKNDKIYNSSATRALRIMAAGMQAGISSPSRRWMRLTAPDPGHVEMPGVRPWLDDNERRMFLVFARSNLYNSLHHAYTDIGAFGTTLMMIEDDADDIMRTYVVPLGSYVLVKDAKDRIIGFIREITFTAEALVREFGYDNCSSTVKRLYDSKHYDQKIDCLHAVLPNDTYRDGAIGPSGFMYTSLWFEKANDAEERFLLESGYEEKPFVAPRWDVTGEDVYGTSPGMMALGDIKGLQHYEKRRAQLMDKLVNPPMVGPSGLKRPSILAGDVTFVDGMGAGSQFTPAHVVDSRALVIGDEIQRIEERINAAFHADLFLMIATSQRPQMTATEVEERHEEKMLQLGPVLERLQDELFDPLIDRTFAIMQRAGMVPPPPDVLIDQELRVEYISIMAQAQKMLGTISIERLLATATGMAQLWPDSLDKIDADQLIDETGDLLGVPAEVIRSDEDVERVRAEKLKAQQAQMMAEMAPAMNQAASAAKTVSEIEGDVQGDVADLTGVQP